MWWVRGRRDRRWRVYTHTWKRAYLRPDVDVETTQPRVAPEAREDLLFVAPDQIDAELGGERADAQLRDAPRADERVDAQADGGLGGVGGQGGEEGGDAVELLEGVGVEVDAVRWWSLLLYVCR